MEWQAWQPIDTAPKGSGADGPQDVRHPDYVEPPKLWLFLTDGEQCLGYWDWYYAEGGSGYDGGTAWVENLSGERVYPTHWTVVSLPSPPRSAQEPDQETR